MKLLDQLEEQYDKLWQAIVRPKRMNYNIDQLGLKQFYINGRFFIRNDIQIINEQQCILECSHFVPFDRKIQDLPCIIYLHGNCSCRIETLSLLPFILPYDITVFTLDLSGQGQSGGEFVSLGYFESRDVACVINYLKQTEKIKQFALWGRSMGAVTALIYAQQDASISSIILDSPFSDLEILVKETAQKKLGIPEWIISLFLKLINKTIKQKVGFEFNDVSPIKIADNCFIPAIFAYAQNDEIIDPQHTQTLFEKYSGDKELFNFPGNHNTQRPDEFCEAVVQFLNRSFMWDSLDQQDIEEHEALNIKMPKQQIFTKLLKDQEDHTKYFEERLDTLELQIIEEIKK